MTGFQWFQVVHAGLITAAMALLWIFRAGVKGQELISRPELLAERLKQVEIRMDRAGEKISDLASAVQGLPESLRRTFLPRELADEYVLESRADRKALHAQLDRVSNQMRDPSARTRASDPPA